MNLLLRRMFLVELFKRENLIVGILLFLHWCPDQRYSIVVSTIIFANIYLQTWCLKNSRWLTWTLLQLLKECTKVTSQETLPDIYDDRNHLEVCDYVDDIYQYYWFMEVSYVPILSSFQLSLDYYFYIM